MKQMFHTSEPATEASSTAGLLVESLPDFEENIEYDNDDDDDNDDDAAEFQDENDEQKGFEQTIQLIKKGTIDKEIKIMTQNKGNGTIQVYDAPTFSCIQNLQPFLKHYLRKKAIAEAQTRKLNRTVNTLISMSSKKAKIKKNVKNRKPTFNKKTIHQNRQYHLVRLTTQTTTRTTSQHSTVVEEKYNKTTIQNHYHNQQCFYRRRRQLLVLNLQFYNASTLWERLYENYYNKTLVYYTFVFSFLTMLKKNFF